MTDLNASDDWRLSNQVEYLRNAVAEWRTYVRPSPDWTHDHCAFCWATFSDDGHADALRQGFVTADGRHWICDRCLQDFRQALNLTVKPERSSG